MKDRAARAVVARVGESNRTNNEDAEEELQSLFCHGMCIHSREGRCFLYRVSNSTETCSDMLRLSSQSKTFNMRRCYSCYEAMMPSRVYVTAAVGSGRYQCTFFVFDVLSAVSIV